MIRARRLLLASLLAASAAACTAPTAPMRPFSPADPSPPPGEAQSPYTNFSARLLALHNRERAAVGVPPLEWDESLAADAAAYGPALAQLPQLAHSSGEVRRGQGENLWMGTRAAYTVEAMFQAWADEQRQFRAGTFPYVTTSGDWQVVGHYTQIVWRGTTRVGCALHQAPRWDYLICRYAPMGNVVGERVP